MTRIGRVIVGTVVAALLAGPVAAAGAQAPGAQAMPRAVAHRAAAQAKTHLFDCRGHLRSEPKNLILTCADANSRLVAIHWSSWGAATARAVGTFQENDCIPDCAGGHFHQWRTHVTVWRVVHTRAYGRLFSRLTVDYVAGGHRRHVVFGLLLRPLTS